jgi:hypothetical protein
MTFEQFIQVLSNNNYILISLEEKIDPVKFLCEVESDNNHNISYKGSSYSDVFEYITTKIIDNLKKPNKCTFEELEQYLLTNGYSICAMNHYKLNNKWRLFLAVMREDNNLAFKAEGENSQEVFANILQQLMD